MVFQAMGWAVLIPLFLLSCIMYCRAVYEFLYFSCNRLGLNKVYSDNIAMLLSVVSLFAVWTVYLATGLK